MHPGCSSFQKNASLPFTIKALPKTAVPIIPPKIPFIDPAATAARYPSRLYAMNRANGFTLVELMVTLAVAAILATVAVPGFTQMIQSNRVTTQTNELVSAFALARSEAIKRGGQVSVTATGNNFATGWCVHLGANCTGTDILRQFPAMKNMTVTPNNQAAIRFDGRGAKTEPAGVISLEIKPQGCPSGKAGMRRTLEIHNTGRSSVTSGPC
ncbi:GspH/FimT family pseudopilin [Ectothiorhodospira shaposhnikovii]|uniref:GspH/FimT family pseudopilin n=1 Tax=Ectothiorhodospira shaposhnikovii TaxID=1054 RepID=UPI001EE8B6A6|nr:GspH/FimT family pseudopilin [Ectothiorhodospira shaposhnikovii]MCG5513293.1 GspH/FimT family pseudopilin [Ectothiorhodospira shaposhnikovii]